MTGDVTALEQAFAVHGDQVHAIARRITGDAAAADDVVQNVFMALWQRPEAYSPARGTLRTWLATVAHHRAVDHIRGEEARRRREAKSGTEQAPSDAADVVVDADADRGRRVREAVARLPEAERAAVSLAYFGGQTYRQVAATMGAPEGTTKSRLRLALRRLGTDLERV